MGPGRRAELCEASARLSRGEIRPHGFSLITAPHVSASSAGVPLRSDPCRRDLSSETQQPRPNSQQQNRRHRAQPRNESRCHEGRQSQRHCRNKRRYWQDDECEQHHSGACGQHHISTMETFSVERQQDALRESIFADWRGRLGQKLINFHRRSPRAMI